MAKPVENPSFRAKMKIPMMKSELNFLLYRYYQMNFQILLCSWKAYTAESRRRGVDENKSGRILFFWSDTWRTKIIHMCSRTKLSLGSLKFPFCSIRSLFNGSNLFATYRWAVLKANSKWKVSSWVEVSNLNRLR